MNTQSTQYHPYERTMPREELRERLIASRMPNPRPWYRDLDEPIDLLQAAELTVFASGMLALIGYGLMWILG